MSVFSPMKDEVERGLVLIYKSHNAQDYTNWLRNADWLDDLPMAGLEELEALLDSLKIDVRGEIEKRKAESDR